MINKSVLRSSSALFSAGRSMLRHVLSSSVLLLLPVRRLSKRNKKILTVSSVVVILIMIPVIFYSLTHLLRAEAAWFDTNFGFRQRVDITNSGSAQTDFQVSFTLNTDTLFDNGKLRADCNDIRVTDVNGKLLPYWIESMDTACGNGQTAQTIWVKMPSISTTGNTLYVYYGNPQASAYSDGNKVFEFFDDFTGTTLSNKWTQITSGTGGISVSGGYAELKYATSTNADMYANFNGISTEVVEFRGIQIMQSPSYRNRINIGTYNAGTWTFYTPGGDYGLFYDGAVAPAEVYFAGFTDNNLNTTDTFNIKYNIVGTNDVDSYYTNRTTGASVYTNTSATWNTSTNIISAVRLAATETTASDFKIDTVWVRKYAATEPSVAAPTNEEKALGPVAHWKFDEGTGTTAKDSTTNGNNGTLTNMNFSATGGTITTSGGYTIHTFTTSGTFTPNGVGNVEVLVVGGGGGGANTGSGGGAGGYVSNSAFPVSQSQYSVTVGDGGQGGQTTAANGAKGSNSVFSTITAEGGGLGVSHGCCAGQNGGSGGGGPITTGGSPLAGGTGSQGSSGGAGAIDAGWVGNSGGGGGAGGAGAAGGNTAGTGNGGVGLANSISGTSVYYAGGGGGGEVNGSYVGTGGNGGGGTAVINAAGGNGTANTGGGGAGGSYTGTYFNGGNGASGIVIVRYPTPDTSPWQSEDQCISGKCLKFDGTNDYINNGGIITHSPSTITTSAWIKTSSSSEMYILSKKGRTHGGWHAYSLRVNNGMVYSRIQQSVAPAFIDFSTSKTVNDGKWHHIALTFGTDFIGRIYIDGVLSATSSSGSAIYYYSQTQNLYIGASRYCAAGNDCADDTTESPFNGFIDEPKIYNYALSAAQVKVDYNRGAEVLGASDASKNLTNGLAGYWKMDGFDPSSVSSLAMWEKADAITGISNGGAVATWSDSSGNGRDLTQATAGNRPTYQTNVINGKPVVRFAAASTQYITNSTNFTTPVTVIYVGKQTGGSNGRVLSSVANNWLLGYWSGGKNQAYFEGWVSSVGTPATDTNWHIYSAVETGSLSTVYADGSQIYSNASGVAGPNGISVGCWASGGPTECSNVDIAEVLVYSSALSSGDRANIEDYLNRKYGLNNTTATYQSYLTDLSGNGNNGTSVNGAYSTTGKYANGASFDGTNDYVDTTVSGSSGYTSTSIGAWVKTTDSTSNKIILGSGEWGFYINRFDSGKFFAFLDGSSGNNDASQDSITTINDGVWHYLFASNDGTTTKIYVDGKLENSFAETYAANASNGLAIGANEGASSFFAGQIDEVRVFNRALSPAEVQQLYNFAPGPVATYNFEEKQGTTVNDTSGNANTGTLTGTVPYWTQGKYGTGGNFNGTDDTVSITDSSNISPTGAITISGWIKASSEQTGKGVITKGPTASDYDYMLYFSSPTKVDFYMKNSAGTADNIGGTTFNYTDNKWHYYTAVFNGDIMYLYIDGVLQISKDTALTNIRDSADALRFAQGWSGFFAGQIDETKIYNYARTSGQIVEDMNGGHPAPGSPVGSPIGYWKFDQGADNTCRGGTNDACNSGSGGSALDGAQSGMAVPATAVSGWNQNGKFGKAMFFDGTNDVVTIPYASSPFRQTDTITYSFWFKSPTNNPGYVAGTSVSGGHGSGGISISSGTIGFNWTPTSPNSDRAYTATPATMTTNVWHHVAIAINFSGAGTGQIYFDGIPLTTTLSASVTTATPTTSYNQNVADSIGGRYVNSQFYFTGGLDEFKVFNSALTAAQVKLEYNQGQSQVLGAISDTSGLTGGNVASNSASAEYCIPGDTTSCAAPVGRWDFEEGQLTTVNDTSGNANTGTWAGTGSHWTSGKYGKGGNFNGSDDNVTLANSSSISPGSGDFTVEVWFKTSTSGTSQYIYWDSVDSSNAPSIQFAVNGADNKMYCLFRDSGSNTVTVSGVGNTVTNGAWHHSVCIRNGTTARLYLDGIPIGTNTNASLATIDVSTGRIPRIGAGSTGADVMSAPFIGQIDNVKVYTYTRSAAQVAWDYNQGKPVGHWKFDECQGPTANDSSGNGNSGTVTIGASGTQTSVGTCSTSGTARYNGVSGKYNYSLNFDGTDDKVGLGNVFSVASGDSITLSGWIKPTRDTNYFFGRAHDNSNLGQYSLYSISGAFRFGISTNVGSGQYYQFGTVNQNQWQLVTVTHTFGNASSTKAYINGVLQSGSWTGDGATVYTNCGASGCNFEIGHWYGTPAGTQDYYWTAGQIDDTKIFNCALTANQVRNVYNNGAVNFAPATGAP